MHFHHVKPRGIHNMVLKGVIEVIDVPESSKIELNFIGSIQVKVHQDSIPNYYTSLYSVLLLLFHSDEVIPLETACLSWGLEVLHQINKLFPQISHGVLHAYQVRDFKLLQKVPY